MISRLPTLLLAAALALPAASASAFATFTTIVTPVADNPDYLYLRIDWGTELVSGPVGTGDLDYLKFTTYGVSGGVQGEDLAIDGGEAQPLGNAARLITDIAFVYVLDLPSDQRHLALKAFDNNLGDNVLTYATPPFPADHALTMLDVSGVLDEGLGQVLVDIAFHAPAAAGPLAPELKYQHADVASVVATPLPGALGFLAAGLGALGLLRRRG